MRIICREQRTSEWYTAHVAKVTASNIFRAMSKLKRASGDRKAGEWSADHDNYVRELAWELITRVPAEHYVSRPMDLGTQYESEARIEYWQMTGNEVEQTGFVLHPHFDFLGCSPDGFTDAAIVELKVPLLSTHERYLIENKIPEDYVLQMQCQMLCCERPSGEFVSYAPSELYPELPEEFRLFRKRLEADPAIHREMEEAATVTMEQAIKLANELRERYPKAKHLEHYRDASEYDQGKSFLDNCDFIDQMGIDAP